VESTPGHGATFTLWLPAGETVTPTPPPSAPAAIPAEVLPRSARVLLMDDEESVRRLGAALLLRMGLLTETVADGAAAVKEFSEARSAGHPYDLVILDLTIPSGMGGREAMEHIRKLDPQVPAIVSSGYSNDPVLADFARYGFQAIVPKPYEVSLLMETVKAIAGTAAISRIHAVGPRLTNDVGDHRIECRAGACRRATVHWKNGSPTSGGPTSDCIVSAKSQGRIVLGSAGMYSIVFGARSCRAFRYGAASLRPYDGGVRVGAAENLPALIRLVAINGRSRGRLLFQRRSGQHQGEALDHLHAGPPVVIGAFPEADLVRRKNGAVPGPEGCTTRRASDRLRGLR